jgi:hypothetical protein
MSVLSFSRGPEPGKVIVHPIQARIPGFPALPSPGRNLIESSRVERARSVLRVLRARHEARLFQHLDVFGNGWQRQLEWLGEFVDGCLTLRQSRHDRPARRTRQGRKCIVEMGYTHQFLLSEMVNYPSGKIGQSLRNVNSGNQIGPHVKSGQLLNDHNERVRHHTLLHRLQILRRKTVVRR